MELVQKFQIMKKNSLLKAFYEAKFAAEEIGHKADFFPTDNDQNFSEKEILREGAWVILCGGFREAVIRRLFANFSLCFCDWESALEILKNRNMCRETALDVFRNEKKVDAIIKLAELIVGTGFEELKSKILTSPIKVLSDIHFIGPITSYHLAKNLGFQVAKPDRHLNKISKNNGFKDAHELCEAIASQTREPISVVDGVLWRLSEKKMTDQFKIFHMQKSDYPNSERLILTSDC